MKTTVTFFAFLFGLATARPQAPQAPESNEVLSKADFAQKFKDRYVGCVRLGTSDEDSEVNCSVEEFKGDGPVFLDSICEYQKGGCDRCINKGKNLNMKVEEWICVPAQTQAGTQAPGEDKQTPTKESVAGQDADNESVTAQDADNESVTAQDADNESVTAQEADKVPGKADEQNGGANQKDNKICADAADLILQDCKKGLRSDNIVGLEACTEAAEKERQKCLAPNKKKAGGPFTISDVCRRTARDFMDNCRKNKTEIAELKKCGNEAREILQACQEKEKAQKGAEGQQGPEKEKTQDEEEGQQCQGEATR